MPPPGSHHSGGSCRGLLERTSSDAAGLDQHPVGAHARRALHGATPPRPGGVGVAGSPRSRSSRSGRRRRPRPWRCRARRPCGRPGPRPCPRRARHRRVEAVGAARRAEVIGHAVDNPGRAGRGAIDRHPADRVDRRRVVGPARAPEHRAEGGQRDGVEGQGGAEREVADPRGARASGRDPVGRAEEPGDRERAQHDRPTAGRARCAAPPARRRGGGRRAGAAG